MKVFLLQARLNGGFGPQPHPSFIEISCQATVHDGKGTLEGAGEDGADMSVRGGFACERLSS
jgi:hypothetical protein